MWRFVTLMISMSMISLAVAASDPCVAVGPKLSAGLVVPLADALLCLKSFKFNATLAKSITSSVAKTLDMTAYRDISKSSPTPEFPLSVDIVSSIKKIGNTTYDSDYSFNKALHWAVYELKDYFSSYYPNCYRRMAARSAFLLGSIVENGVQKIIVSPLAPRGNIKVANATEIALNILLKNYVNATVLSIDGVPAVDYAKNFAQKYNDGFRDLSTSYNMLFVRLDLFGNVVNGGLTGQSLEKGFPNMTRTLVLKRVGSSKLETLKVPFFVHLIGNGVFSSGADYWAKFCAKSSSQASSQAGFLKGTGKGLSRSSPPIMEQVEESLNTGKSYVTPQGSLTTVLDDPSGLKFYLLSDGKTGVLTLPDFFSSSVWQANVFNGISKLKQLNATRLIIDVKYNGGGNDFLGSALATFLFPTLKYPWLNFQHLATPFVQRLVKKSNALLGKTSELFQYQSQYNWFTNIQSHPKSGLITSSDDFFFPLEVKTLGGVKGNYSKQYRFGFPPYPYGSWYESSRPSGGSNELIRPAADVTPPFLPKNVLLLSDGFCSATCAIFAYILQEQAGVKVVTEGGIKGRKMTISSGLIGSGYDLDTLLTLDLPYLNATKDPDAPKPLSVQAYVGYTSAMVYSRNNSTVPADFVFKKSDFHIDYTAEKILNLEKIYEEVAKFFPK